MRSARLFKKIFTTKLKLFWLKIIIVSKQDWRVGARQLLGIVILRVIQLSYLSPLQ